MKTINIQERYEVVNPEEEPVDIKYFETYDEARKASNEWCSTKPTRSAALVHHAEFRKFQVKFYDDEH